MERKFGNVFFSCYFSAVSMTLLLSQVTGNLVVAPENRVAAVGQSVLLKCSTNDSISVNWLHFPLGSTLPIDVYISRTVVYPYHPRFTVQNFTVQDGRIIEKRSLGSKATAYNLLITDIRTEDAGRYRCVDRTGMGEHRDAELTVIGTHPNCITNIGPNGFIGENDCGRPIDEIRSSCSIEYAGNIAPEMNWTTTSEKDTIQPQPQPQPIMNISEKKVSSEWSFNATASINGASVVWFSMQSTQTKWTSTPIKMLYVKQNLTTLILSLSENVTCIANSSQQCSYKWTAEIYPENKSNPFEGQTLEVNKPGIYLCHACCQLHEQSCTVRGLRVEYSTGSGNINYPVYVFIVVGVLLVLAILIAVVIFIVIYWYKYKRMPKEKKNPPSGSPTSSNASSLSDTDETKNLVHIKERI